MRTIIAGGRDFTDHDLFLSVMSSPPWEITQVVCGCARGADHYGSIWAQINGIPVAEFPVTPADWNKYGKRAGILRNAKMADNADALIAFWDGKSPGTKNMIEIAKRKQFPTLVIRY